MSGFWGDVREKGFRRAVYESIDRTVERITAGMDVQDVREALRGEKPSRKPNPRLTPHADSFWFHTRPGYYHREVTGIYPTFRLGWLSAYFVFFETITGIILMLWYTPSPEIAYSNMLNIMGNVPLGQFMRDLHRLGAEAMVLIVALHMLRTLITGSYKKPRQFTWFTGVLLLVITGLLSFTGYLLPWDQLSLWAVTIGSSIAESVPAAGEDINLLIRGAPELGENGLLRFYLLHVVALPAVLFIFFGVHYYKVIRHGLSLPPQSENIGEDTARRVPPNKRVYFIPDILTSELMWVGVTTFIMIVLVTWFYHAPLENPADPQLTPMGTTAPWYFLWIQGALKLGDTVLWGIVCPAGLLIGLAFLPYIDTGPSRRYKDRRLVISLGLLLVVFITVFSYMGLPEFGVSTSAELEILHELAKEPTYNEMGIIRPVPFDQLVVGWYTTRELAADETGEKIELALSDFNTEIMENGQFGQLISELSSANLAELPAQPEFRPVSPDAPELYGVLEQFYHLLEEEYNELPNAWGAIIVTQNQEGLKRVDMAISWDAVVMVNGDVQFDDLGNPVPKMEPRQIPLLDENGLPVMRIVVDEENHAVLDESGLPVMEAAFETVEVRERRISTESSPIFLHEDSAYFQ